MSLHTQVARLQRRLSQHCDAIVGSTLLQVKILEAPTANRLQKTKDKVKWAPESDKIHSFLYTTMQVYFLGLHFLFYKIGLA